MRRRSVVFAPEARDDLKAIYNWVTGASSEKTALHFVASIESYCLGFDIASERGQRVLTARKNVRAVGFRRQATVLFEVSPNVVRILRIHGAGKDWSSRRSRND